MMDELIYDWNTLGDLPSATGPAHELVDRTLAEARRCGTDVDALASLARHASALPIAVLHLGPADAGAARLVSAIRKMGVAARLSATLAADAEAAAAARLAAEVEVNAEADGDPAGVALMLAAVAAAGAEPKLRVLDAARVHPADLRRLLEAAFRAGAARVVLDDTPGRATPEGAAHLVAAARGCTGMAVEWCGSNDRDLALANALGALAAGAVRLHGAVLGLGAGAGRTPLDLLLVNLRLLERTKEDLTRLGDYVQSLSRAAGLPIPINYPVFGEDAFRTATGVHAAAIIKAQAKGHTELADRVYSGVPAAWFGHRQVIDVGPMSGESNVIAWMRGHGVAAAPDLVKRVLARAKTSNHTLSEREIREEIERHQRDPAGAAAPRGKPWTT